MSQRTVEKGETGRVRSRERIEADTHPIRRVYQWKSLHSVGWRIWGEPVDWAPYPNRIDTMTAANSYDSTDRAVLAGLRAYLTICDLGIEPRRAPYRPDPCTCGPARESGPDPRQCEACGGRLPRHHPECPRR